MTAAVRPRAVLLDFDGLICDTESAGHRAWREIYAACGLRFPESLWHSMVGRADGERLAADDLAARVGGTRAATLVADRKERKRQLCDSQPLRPGVRELLDAARARGVQAAVVSSAPHAWVAHHLQRLGVRDRFAALVTGDLAARHKPHPDLYELALRVLDCAPAHAVAFEDSAIGVRAARAAGVRCLAVPNAVGDAAELGHADAVLPSLTHYDLAADGFRTEGTPVV
ncbi:HAD family phosphatase [Streptomyces sp. TRM70350]|uniref:HAD family hydrolase n=1 Tax=Streptomyces sp. TRM70350 TaxID=2856165 RepID=UPI001C48FC91|nr:HAD-IA family hydrolase [Streptomyces sp. TRM70350]MBV7696595.1 HAD-IA family hydrolase [Streptomyces sp. TRM70350]